MNKIAEETIIVDQAEYEPTSVEMYKGFKVTVYEPVENDADRIKALKENTKIAFCR